MTAKNTTTAVDTTWTNAGATGLINVAMIDNSAFSNTTHFNFTFTVTGAQPGSCQSGPTGGPVTPDQVLGGAQSRAFKNAACSQGSATGFPISTSTGNFWHSFEDLVIPGRGFPLAMRRTYNAYPGTTVPDGPLGFGWSFPYGMSLVVDSTSVTLIEEGGSRITFTGAGPSYTAPPRVIATLVRDLPSAGFYTLTRQAQETLVFNSSGQLVSQTDLNGHATTLAYTSGRLSSVTDSAGRVLTFSWVGSHIKTVTDANEPSQPARVVTFTYGANDAGPDLTKVVDVTDGRTTFAYDANHRMTRMRLPNQFDASVPIGSDPEVILNGYDSSGRVVSQTDQLGRVTSFDYTTVAGSTIVTEPAGEDPAGNPVTHARLDTYDHGVLVSQTLGYATPAAATWQREYDPDTLGCTKVTDPNGHEWSATYDAAGNRTSSTDPLGRTSKWTWTSKNLLKTVVDARGNEPGVDPVLWTTTLAYDTAGCACNLLSRSRPRLDAAGTTVLDTQVTTFRYGERGNEAGDVTTVVDPLSKLWTTDYDAFGSPVTTTDPLGHVTKTVFDHWGRKISETTPRGNLGPTPDPGFTSRFTYDPDNALRTTTVANPPEAPLTTSASYDLNRNLLTATDGKGNDTVYEYDAADQARFVHRADTTTTETRYWPDGSLKTQLDGAGNFTKYYYDAQGRLTTTVDPLGRPTAYGYDPAGNPTTKQEPGGDCNAVPQVGCTSFGYDIADQLTSVTYSDATTADVSDIDYLANGARKAMTEVTKDSPVVTSVSKWKYDSLDRLVSSTDANGATVGYAYDLRDALKTITYPGGTNSVVRNYDDAGRWKSVTDWLGNKTTFGYDEDDNLVTLTGPPATGVVDTFDFDNAGRLTSVAVAKAGNPLLDFDYGRDGADQITSVAATSTVGLPADNHTYVYNPLNRIKSDSAATDTFRYDPADNVTQHSNGRVQAFDAANQLTASAGITVVGSGGAADNATATSLTANLPAGVVANDQIVVAATLPGSKAATVPTGYVSMGKASTGLTGTDAKVQLFRRTAAGGETAVTVSFGGTYAKALNVAVYRGVDPTTPVDATLQAGTASSATSVTAPSLTTTAMADRLVMAMGATSAAAAGTWTVPVGMSRRGNQRSAGSALTAALADTVVAAPGAAGTRTATFAPSANLVGLVVALRPAATTAYAYDQRGNRTSGPNGSTLGYDQANRLTAAGTSTYAYDGAGLRMTKTVAGSATDFAWDQSQGLPMLLTAGGTSYVYGPGGLPVEHINSNSVVTYYHHDQLGSTRALSKAAGTVVATFTYDTYGRLKTATGTATTPFGFAGQYTDAETGFQYLRARYYDPATGQFLTRDPIEAQTRSAYGYVRGNPLNWTDPSGLCWGPTCVVEAAVAVGVDAWDSTGGAAVAWANDNPGDALAIGLGTVAVVATGGAALAGSGAFLGVAAGSWGTAATAAGFAGSAIDIYQATDACTAGGRREECGYKIFASGVSVAGVPGLPLLGRAAGVAWKATDLLAFEGAGLALDVVGALPKCFPKDQRR